MSKEPTDTIPAGPANLEKLTSQSWFKEKKGRVIRQIRPGPKRTHKTLWSGTANGMGHIGHIQVDEKNAAYSKVIVVDGWLRPLAMKEWGDFVVRYINYIMKEEEE